MLEVLVQAFLASEKPVLQNYFALGSGHVSFVINLVILGNAKSG